MSSLWTPDGEHRVPRPGEGGSGTGATSGPPPAGSGPPGGPGAPGGERGSGGPSAGRGRGREVDALTEEEQRAAEEEMVELARQLAAAPAEDVVANHCYGLFELAALHLSQQPPRLDKARLAIDALGMLVEGLGDRLGQHAEALAEGLSQLRLAFVRIANVPSGPTAQSNPGGDGPDPSDAGPIDARAENASDADDPRQSQSDAGPIDAGAE